MNKTKPGGRRYVALTDALRAIAKYQAPPTLRFVEIGTYDGQRTYQLFELWHRLTRKPVVYHGFDLWEQLTPEKAEAEFSKPNPPPAAILVEACLRMPYASVTLYRGDTLDTLPPAVKAIGEVDLIFVDGGHSTATLASDVRNAMLLMHAKTELLVNDYRPDCYDSGCKFLLRVVNETPGFFARPLDAVDQTALGPVQMLQIQRCDPQLP